MCRFNVLLMNVVSVNWWSTCTNTNTNTITYHQPSHTFLNRNESNDVSVVYNNTNNQSNGFSNGFKYNRQLCISFWYSHTNESYYQNDNINVNDTRFFDPIFMSDSFFSVLLYIFLFISVFGVDSFYYFLYFYCQPLRQQSASSEFKSFRHEIQDTHSLSDSFAMEYRLLNSKVKLVLSKGKKSVDKFIKLFIRWNYRLEDGSIYDLHSLS